MQVSQEMFEAMAEVVLTKMLQERISKVAAKYQDVSTEKSISAVTLDQVKDVSAFDEGLEALASAILGKAPNLKKEMPNYYADAIKQRIKWAKPKSKPKAEF